MQTPLPYDLHACPAAMLVRLVAAMLARLVAHNDRIPVTALSLTRFHSRAPPAISVLDYLARIVRYANIEIAVLPLILVYIDRICAKFPSFTISSLTAHRFIITAVMVGCKSLSDQYCTNSYYAKVGGISLSEINVLELEFCQMMKWELTCTEETLQSYYRSLVRTSDSLRVCLASDGSHASASDRTSAASTNDASGSALGSHSPCGSSDSSPSASASASAPVTSSAHASAPDPPAAIATPSKAMGATTQPA